MGGDNIDIKNIVLAAVLSMLVIIGWQVLFPPEPPAPIPAETQAEGGQPTREGGAADPVVALDREAARASGERQPLDAPEVSGSLSLRGGRIDDLDLSGYRVELDPESDTVTLLNPTNAPDPYFVVYGWLRTAEGDPGPLPNANTPWRAVEGERLSPDSPVTLEWDNGAGLTFRRTLEIDDQYMFTVTQSVENATDAPVALAPYGYVARRGVPDTTGFFILHEGALGVVDGELEELDYSDLADLPPNTLEGGRAQAVQAQQNGWLGFTDKYWMTALAPRPGQVFDAVYKTIPGARPEFRTEMRLPVMSVAPGARAETATYLFAGAKEYGAIRGYQDALGIDRFDDAIDWGWFYFLTKPIFQLLDFIQSIIGNMGWSIIILTLLVKMLLFPLAYKSYVSMSKMKALQPQMEKIKERAGDDKMRMQKEMMELYKKEKVNPASGCLPILLQIPIFFSLYKVLFVAIEMRHAPFVGWIDDLSAPDPTSWMNLFGALPYDIPPFLALFSIGVYPIVLGVTMWLQQKLNPAPTDQMQATIFAWMPWVFMFMLGQFAVGLVIYWCANNIITFAQQYLIMRSQGVKVDLLGNIKAGFSRKRES